MDSEQADSLNQTDFKQVHANCKEKKTWLFPDLPDVQQILSSVYMLKQALENPTGFQIG